MELEEFTSETIDSGVRQISIEEGGNLSRTEQGIRKTDCCQDVSVRVIPRSVTFY